MSSVVACLGYKEFLVQESLRTSSAPLLQLLFFSIDQCLKSGSDRCRLFFFFPLEITSSALCRCYRGSLVVLVLLCLFLRMLLQVLVCEWDRPAVA